jgi:hypothetical protein
LVLVKFTFNLNYILVSVRLVGCLLVSLIRIRQTDLESSIAYAKPHQSWTSHDKTCLCFMELHVSLPAYCLMSDELRLFSIRFLSLTTFSILSIETFLVCEILSLLPGVS